MSIWTGVTVEATTRADRHISIRHCVEDVVEFRVELDGDTAINFLQKLNKWLRAVCYSHTMEIYGLLMY